MAYTKEERYEIRYAVPTSEGNWSEKRVCGKSKEWFDRNKAKCKELGYKIIKASKLYPFNTWKNQHNFGLIRNICFNTIHDMYSGEIKYDDAEIERLEAIEEKASRFFGLELPMAWLPWDEWKDAKELSEMATLHRQDRCIENGRPDLVTYC